MRLTNDYPLTSSGSLNWRTIIASLKTHVGWTSVSIALAFALFCPSIWFDFVTYDDPGWIAENPKAQRGLSLANVVYASGAIINGTWNPLALISFMADVTLFGVKPGMMHLTNVWLHLINIYLAIRLLCSLGFSRTTAGICGLVFAIHPINVEAVCWVSERKGLLGAMFGLLTLLAYVDLRRQGRAKWRVWLFFILALLSKPSSSALPLLFILFDLWFLNKPGERRIKAILIEKLPFIATVVGLIILQYLGQSRASGIAQIPLDARLRNAVVSLTRYIGHFAWPESLNVCYLWRPWSNEQVTLAAFVLSMLLMLGVLFRTRSRAPLFGLSFFVIAIAPTLQLVQLGHIGMADRYQYIPSLGLILPVAALLAHWKKRHSIVVLAVVAAFATALSIRTFRQVATWRDSGALYTRALAVNPYNSLMEINLALWQVRNGLPEPAVAHASAVVQRDGTEVLWQMDLIDILQKAGKPVEALATAKASRRLFPTHKGVLWRLASAYRRSAPLDQTDAVDWLAICRELEALASSDTRIAIMHIEALAANNRESEALVKAELLINSNGLKPSERTSLVSNVQHWKNAIDNLSFNVQR